jgi:2-polyprenyl-6-hydroxyphenyl methylase/3-demethylubiquinone-9 3-methyltransferase
VLDYGCGRGEFTVYLASLGFRVAGLDLSSEAIRFNQQDFPQLEFVQVDGDEPAPFEDGGFDAIWSSEVIEHVYDVHAIFAEFARLLRPGGKLVLTTPYHGWLKNVLVVTFGFERHFNVEWQHIRFWTRKSLTKVAGDHDLRAIEWNSIGRVPMIAKSFLAVFERGISRPL